MNNLKRHVFLIGLMGAGKTSIGKRLATIVHAPFIDCDQEIEKNSGVYIQTIFDLEGEIGFRKRENKLLKQLCQHLTIPTIIATGGGILVTDANHELLAQHGIIVYIKPSLEQIIQRLHKDKKRPLLQTPDRNAIIQKLYANRNYNYEKLADFIILPTDEDSQLDIAIRIADCIT